MVTKTGMQTLIQQAMKNGSSGATVEQGTGAEIPFDPTSYRSVHFLAANTEKRPFEDLLKKTVQGGRTGSVGLRYDLGGRFELIATRLTMSSGYVLLSRAMSNS